jgi:4-hydroxy-tetrahydrodipicolinate reductase
MMKVAVLGAGGKMGKEVIKAVLSDDDLNLVAAVDPAFAGAPLRELAQVDSDLKVLSNCDELSGVSPEVAIDFTNANSAYLNAKILAKNKIHSVIGTTGFKGEQIQELAALFKENNTNIMIIPNFAIGAALMMYFSSIAANYFEKAEIIELHHDQKLDAPSGTALATANLINKAKDNQVKAFSSNGTEERPARGQKNGSVSIHSVRLPGLVAHQEVIFGLPGQLLTVRHDSVDRSSFMPGVLLAVKKIKSMPGLTTSLLDVLGIKVP